MCSVVISRFFRILWVAFALFAGVLLLNPAAQAAATATGFTFKGDAQTTRITVDVSRDVGYSARVLPDPFRVIVDMADVSFDVPPGLGRKGAGLVKALRYGIIEEGKSRIVIDTAGPVLIQGSFLKPKDGKKPAQIIIDLMAIDQDVFDAAYAKDNPGYQPKPKAAPDPEPEVAEAEPAVQPVIIKPVPKPEPQVETPPAPKQVIAKPARPDGKKVIVIDAGHGGMDPGAVGPTGTKEKDVVLAFAQSLKAAIDADGRNIAIMTRGDDTFMTLLDRVKFAREHHADLMIAIHADIVRGKTATGTTIYTLSDQASDEEAEALAQKENRADMVGGIDLGLENEDVTDVLIELIRRESKNYAVSFSRNALKELQRVTPMAGKPLRSAGFKVLKAPDVPSVLVELGFLSTKADEERLLSTEWRAETAKAMTAAINRHFATEVAANR